MKKNIYPYKFIVGNLFGSCWKADTQGIVLEVNEHGIKLAQGLSSKEYEKIKNENSNRNTKRRCMRRY